MRKTPFISGRIVALFVVSSLSFYGKAADYFWVGGSGNWSDVSHHWATSSGGATFYERVPASIDNVIFDANSFTASNQTVTFDFTDLYLGNMSWKDVTHLPTFTGGGENSVLSISGSLILSKNMNFNFIGLAMFTAWQPGQILDPAGKLFARDVVFEGDGGWLLEGDLNVGWDLYLKKGSLNTNGKSVTAGSFWSNDGAASRSLTLGSSVFTLTKENFGNWQVASDYMTFNAGNSIINIQGYGPAFNGGGFTYHSLNFTTPQTSQTPMINASFDGPVTFAGIGRAQDCTFKDTVTFADISNGVHPDIVHCIFYKSVVLPRAGSIGAGSVVHGNVTVGWSGGVGGGSADNPTTIDGKTTIWGDAYVNGLITFKDNVTVGGYAFIQGPATFQDTLVLKGNADIYSGNSFNHLKLAPGFTYMFESGSVSTFAGSLIALGTGSFPIRIKANTSGKPASLVKTSGTVCLDFVWLSDISASGGALFNAGKAPEHSLDMGGNAGWSFNSACPLAVQVNKWTGAVSTAWENPQNWSLDVVPDANTDVVIENGIIEVRSSALCKTLTNSVGVNVIIKTGGKLTIKQ